MVTLPTVSVIIPTYNEEINLLRLLPQLLALPFAPEIIVSDGGSSDGTLRVAEKFKTKITCLAKGRGPQLNAGAQLAENDVLLFLHADSTLPESSYTAMLEALNSDPGLKGGAFRFSLGNSKGGWPRIYAFNVHLRCKLFNLPYGDQGYFIRRSSWEDGLQFLHIPLMEDVEWWERLQGKVKMQILPCPLITSARRFEQRGYLKSAIRNLSLLMRYKIGVSPSKLVKEYDR